MKESYVVAGCGRFGSSVAKTLYKMGYEVLAIDKNIHVIEEIADHVTQAVQADTTDENAIHSLGVKNYDVAIVSSAESLEASIITTILFKQLGIKKIICKAKNELQGKILSKVGADGVVYPERDMGEKLAHSLVSKNVLDLIELDPNYSVAEISVVGKWIGKTLTELDLRAKFGLNVIAIKSAQATNISPSGEDMLKAGDIVVVIGESGRLNRIDDLYE